jgi:hypothetical protein
VWHSRFFPRGTRGRLDRVVGKGRGGGWCPGHGALTRWMEDRAPGRGAPATTGDLPTTAGLGAPRPPRAPAAPAAVTSGGGRPRSGGGGEARRRLHEEEAAQWVGEARRLLHGGGDGSVVGRPEGVKGSTMLGGGEGGGSKSARCSGGGRSGLAIPAAVSARPLGVRRARTVAGRCGNSDRWRAPDVQPRPSLIAHRSRGGPRGRADTASAVAVSSSRRSPARRAGGRRRLP